MTYYQVRFEKRAQKTLKKMNTYQANMIMAWIKRNLIKNTNTRIHGKGLKGDRNRKKTLKKINELKANIIIDWINKHLVKTTNPRIHGKGLKGDRSGEWRYRIGDYRLIAHIDDEKVTILILELGHRRDIYK